MQAALAAQAAAMVAGTDAAMKAYADREAARAAGEAADIRLAEAVDALVKTGQSLEDIADLTDVPLSDVRSARRRGRPEEEDGEEPAVPPPAVAASSGGGRRRRDVAVAPPADPSEVSPVLGEGGDQVDGQSSGDGEPGGEAPGESVA